MRVRLFTLLSLSGAALAHGDVHLPALISDNMVLQQDTADNVWGTADAGEKVSVRCGDKPAAEVTANAEGKWNVKLTGLPVGEVADLTIAGKNTIVVKNVAVGEVWVCSGQSNMEFTMRGTLNATEEIAAADYPKLRVFTVAKAASVEPKTDVVGKWEVCTPQVAEHFTAVGYFFGRKLLQDLKIPIGLIHSSWGGTPAEFWTPTENILRDPALAVISEDWEKTKANYPKAKADYDAAMVNWTEGVEKAKADGTKPPSKPSAPRGGDAFGGPACLYNGMIAPLLPYTIRGATWYQGESNASKAKQYQRLFPTMIQSWRERWNVGEFPFLFVQLVNYMARKDEPGESSWAELREAQLETLELPHTGMAVGIDVGEAGNIHPKNKQEIGRRLALNALATVYYQDVAYSGPIMGGAQTEEGKIRLTFRFSEGMKSSDGGPLKGFSIAGDDHKFVWATAEIQGDHVLVSSPSVPHPVAARYGWADNPEVNLVNEAGLPASPFRTDDWGRP